MRLICLTSMLLLALAAGAETADAATVSSMKGLLSFSAGPGEANRLTVIRAPSTFRVIDPGATVVPGVGCTATGPSQIDCVAQGVRRVQIQLGDLDDTLTLGISTRTIADGGDGNDTLEGGEGSDDLLGGPGNDGLFAGDGFDLVDGGAGADTLSGG